MAGVLAPLRHHGSLDCTLALLDLASDTRSLRRRSTITRDMVVLLEGVLLFRPPVDEDLDLRVLVDIDPALVPARLRARDGGTQEEVEASFREKLLPARDWFWRAHRPDVRADLVIDHRDVDAPRVVRGVRLPGRG